MLTAKVLTATSSNLIFLHFCISTASRIRGAVSQVKFDEFHRHSMNLLKAAVFGIAEDGKVRKSLHSNSSKGPMASPTF